jgi:hypothetical protein
MISTSKASMMQNSVSVATDCAPRCSSVTSMQKVRPLALVDLILDDHQDAGSDSGSTRAPSCSVENSAPTSPSYSRIVSPAGCLLPPPGLEHPSGVAVPSELPSLGSAFHSSGKCKPCGWFWKAEGCQNGFQCYHCHLCPQDAIKLRRKTKRDAVRVFSSAVECETSDDLQERCTDAALTQQALPSHVPKGPPSPPMSAPMLFTDSDGLNVPSSPVHPPPPAFAPTLLIDVDSSSLPSPPIHSPRLKMPQYFDDIDAPSPPSHSPSCQLALPSVGSLLHGSGKCKPCAFFHKEQGCINGQACQHCHACSPGELKMRKKGKAASRKVVQASGFLAAEPTRSHIVSLSLLV